MATKSSTPLEITDQSETIEFELNNLLQVFKKIGK